MGRAIVGSVVTGILMICVSAVMITGIVTGHDVTQYASFLGSLGTMALAGLNYSIGAEVKANVNGRMTQLIEGLAASAPARAGGDENGTPVAE